MEAQAEFSTFFHAGAYRVWTWHLYPKILFSCSTPIYLQQYWPDCQMF